MVPSLGNSMKLRQRKMVLLPDPLAPMIAMRSPRLISRSTPLTTCRSPNRLCRLQMRMTVSSIRCASVACSKPPFEARGQVAAGIDQDEVHQGDNSQDFQRAVVGGAQQTTL